MSFYPKYYFIFSLYFLNLTATPSLAGGETDFVVKFLFTFPDSTTRTVSFFQPHALAIDPEGQVYVVDSGNHRLVKFDVSGNLLQSVGGFGWEREQFDRPLDVTVKTGLDLFIADYNNERIERYDLKLNYISSFYSNNSLPATRQFGFPSSVDISRHGEIFIVDNENNRILKLNAEGQPDLSFGDFNWGEGQLLRPVSIDVSATDQVYVSDQQANEVVVFDYYGNFITRFGGDILREPGGLTRTNEGALFVADSGHHQVAVFSKEHQLIFRWGDFGKKLGAFNNPLDVGFHENKIYVLDSGNARVQVFELTPYSVND